MNATRIKSLPPEMVIGVVGRVRERANLYIEKELAARGVEGIVPAHGAVLFLLFAEKKGIPLKELVERTGRVKSTITGVVNTLARHGYAEKQADATDGRVALVRLTPKGRRLEKIFREISDRLQTAMYGAMPLSDRRRLMALLSVVDRNLAD